MAHSPHRARTVLGSATQNVFLAALDPDALDGDHPYAATLLNAALELLRSDLRLTIDALQAEAALRSQDLVLRETAVDEADGPH